MSISALLLSVWLILVGATWLGWIAVDGKFLGLWAFVTGIVWLVEQFHPIKL
jgi:hypothetical protein